MLLPYRAKNPPEHFPYVTIGLIAINVLVYLCTSEYFLVVREDAVKSLALYPSTLLTEPWRIVTAMFLHGDIEHILGNMLFLWLFGASVEGRLRPAKFLAVYLVAGIAGDLLQEVIQGGMGGNIPSLGASGAIMGMAGAYLYMFPYSEISIFYWFYIFVRGVFNVQARWVVLFYVSLDALSAFFFKGGDGIGHLAHLGGFGLGLLAAFVLGARRDSEEVSAVQAVHAETRDYTALSLGELETLLQQPTQDMNLVMAYLEKAAAPYAARYEACLAMVNYYANPLVTQASPERLAYILLHIPTQCGGVSLVIYLRVASKLERLYSNDLASQLYRRVYDLSPTAPETETALFRMGQLMQNVFQNSAHAQATYQELLRLFPNGQMAFEARRALQSLAVPPLG